MAKHGLPKQTFNNNFFQKTFSLLLAQLQEIVFLLNSGMQIQIVTPVKSL